jgi:hypothetical protein
MLHILDQSLYDCIKYLHIHTSIREIGPNMTSIAVHIYLNETYTQEFGCNFYNAWNYAQEPNPILEYFFVVNDDINSIDFLLSDKCKKYIRKDVLNMKGKIRLSRFYKTFLYEANTELFNNTATEKEKLFFKRIGQKLLKFILNEIISSIVSSDDYLIIEASGGKDIDDMKSLDKYYRSLGFKPVSLDEEYLDYAYRKMHLVMYTKIKELQ